MLLFLVYNYLRDLIGYLSFLNQITKMLAFLPLSSLNYIFSVMNYLSSALCYLRTALLLANQNQYFFSSVSLNKSLKVNYFTQKLSYLSLIKASILYSVFQITEKLICTAHVLVPHSCFSIFWYVKYCFHF